jgi:hypothetical protein
VYHLGRRIKYGNDLRRHVKRYQLQSKISTIISILGDDAQDVFNWAQTEARRIRKQEKDKSSLGSKIFDLISREAAIRLVSENYKRGRMTTKSEVKKKTGLRIEMPVLYREAGLRHPQEARNLRHNIFHNAFEQYILKILPDVETHVPQTGEGLTPDLMVTHHNPEWTISVEYKGYRSITLLSESELLKGMRYQAEWGSAWLVTTTTKSVRDIYGPTLSSQHLIKTGMERLERIGKRPIYTNEQRENRGIAKKGIKHLQKQKDLDITCKLLSAEELIESCKQNKPLKGLAITTGFEFNELLNSQGFVEEADDVLRIMKTPTYSLTSDKVTAVRLIE